MAKRRLGLNEDGLFTTGGAAIVARASQQTIIRSFDRGEIAGFRIPGSKFRRIPIDALRQYLNDNDVPTDLLPPRAPVVLIAALLTLEEVEERFLTHDCGGLQPDVITIVCPSDELLIPFAARVKPDVLCYADGASAHPTVDLGILAPEMALRGSLPHIVRFVSKVSVARWIPAPRDPKRQKTGTFKDLKPEQVPEMLGRKMASAASQAPT